MVNCYRSQELRRLEKLPAEVLLVIQQYLPNVDRALFAILSHEIQWKVGYHPNTLSLPERVALVSNLDQWNMYPELILCQYCNKFHRPELSLANQNAPAREKLPCQFGSAYQRIRTPYFDRHPHKNVVAGLIRRQRLRHLLRSVPTSSNLQSMTMIHKQTDKFQMDSLRDLKVVGGRCLLKMQDIFYCDDDLTKARLRQDSVVHFRLGRQLSGTCPHFPAEWMIQETFLPSGWNDQPHVSVDRILDCLWGHEKPC